jgi:hypothetical protein
VLLLGVLHRKLNNFLFIMALYTETAGRRALDLFHLGCHIHHLLYIQPRNSAHE